MDDPIIPGSEERVDYVVSPEAGAGKAAADFRIERPSGSTPQPQEPHPQYQAFVPKPHTLSPEEKRTIVDIRDKIAATKKVDSAITRVGNAAPIPKEQMTDHIIAKQQRLDKLVEGYPGMIFSGESLGEVRIDKNGAFVLPETKKETNRTKIALDYAGTEAAISAMYTPHTSSVESLPPSAFEVQQLSALTNRVDKGGYWLTTAGVYEENSNIKTRLYSIPGQQIDSGGKPIPVSVQKLLVVQDVQNPDGTITRNYAVSTAEDIAEYIEKNAERNPNESRHTDTQPSSHVKTQQRTTPSSENVVDVNQKFSAENHRRMAKASGYMGHIGRIADLYKTGEATAADIQQAVTEARNSGMPANRIVELLRWKLPKVNILVEQSSQIEQHDTPNNMSEKQEPTINPEDLIQRDFTDLLSEFNITREMLLKRGVDLKTTNLEGLPIGMLQNAAFVVIDDKYRNAYAQIENSVRQTREQFRLNEGQESTGNSAQPLDQKDFRKMRNRVDRSRMIKEDIEGVNGERYQRAAIGILRQMEQRCINNNPGYTEKQIDARSYKPQRLTRTCKSPSGETLTEQYIGFVRRNQSGAWEWLGGDSPVLVNGDLYNIRQESGIHNDSKVYSIPSLNERGEYAGVITLRE